MTNEEFIKSVSLEGEEWRDVVGFEGIYKISNKQRVLSLNRIVSCNNGRTRTVKGKILKYNKDKNGYITVTLTKNNYDKPYYLHRIIAQSFVENPNNYPQVDHIDGNHLNNNISNLRFCTMRMNLSYPKAHKHLCEAMAIKSKTDKPYTKKSVVGIDIYDQSNIKFYDKIQDTKNDGFKPSSVSRCCRNKLQQHNGYRFMYLSDYETLVNKSKNEAIQAND